MSEREPTNAELLAAINNSTERVLDRIGTVEARLTTVETRIEVLRGLVFALPGVLAGVLEQLPPRSTA